MILPRSLPQDVLEFFRRRNGNLEALLGLLRRLALATEVVRLLRHRASILRAMSSTAHPLDSAWARVERGYEHVHTLAVEIAAWGRSLAAQASPVSAIGALDPDANYWRLRVKEVPTVPSLWGVLVADAIHNFRSALDQFAWELAFVDSSGIDHDSASFPLVRRLGRPWRDCGRDYEGKCTRQLKGVTLRHRAMIKRYQPYHGWAKGRTHPFETMGAIDNDNKHRTVQPVFATATQWGTFFREEGTDCRFRDTAKVFIYSHVGRPLHPGTPLVDVPVVVTGPHPEMHMKANGVFYISFRNGVPVRDSLEEMGKLVSEVLLEFSPSFSTRKARRVWRPREGRVHTVPPARGETALYEIKPGLIWAGVRQHGGEGLLGGTNPADVALLAPPEGM